MQYLIKYLPALLCLVVSLLHPIWVTHYDADPWKLGSFRMFSRVSEKLLVFEGLATDGQTYKIEVSAGSLNPHVDRINSLELLKAEALPRHGQLKNLLESMAELRVIKVSDGFKLISNNDALLNFHEGVVTTEPLYQWRVRQIFTKLGVSVWNLKFNHQEGRLSYVKSASETHLL